MLQYGTFYLLLPRIAFAIAGLFVNTELIINHPGIKLSHFGKFSFTFLYKTPEHVNGPTARKCRAVA